MSAHEPAFQYCRNPRCHSRMPAVLNDHARFCCRGCWESFYLRRCIVCERETEGKRNGRLVCRWRSCKLALNRERAIYRPFAASNAGTATTLAEAPLVPAEVPISCGFARTEPDIDADERERERQAEEAEKRKRPPIQPIVRGLRARGNRPSWMWRHMGGADDDWELFNREGKMVARVRQEGDAWWVARPRMTPCPPLESRDEAMRRGESAALWAMPLVGSSKGKARDQAPAGATTLAVHPGQ